MKKICWAIIALAAFYIAGAYRLTPLMIFSAAALLILPVMFAVSRLLRRSVSAEFKSETGAAAVNSEYRCNISCKNQSRLPVGRFCVRVCCGYGADKPIKKRLYGSLEPKSSGELSFDVYAPYCGLLKIRADRLYVSDFLGLFSAPKCIESEINLAVFPRENRMNISLAPSFGMSGFAGSSSPRGGDDLEVKQLREYRDGDSAKLIHRNQSARTGTLWVKELEKQTDFIAELYLISGKETTTERMSIFYEILSALVLGLLDSASAVRVYFTAHTSAFMVSGREQVRPLLLEIYKAEIGGVRAIKNPNAITLSTDLELCAGGAAVKKFTEDDYLSELGSGCVLP